MDAQGSIDLREHVRAGGLLPARSPVVVMLSGGRDSVCLLDLAVDLCSADRVSALHVNYGLRDTAGEDQVYCEALCARLRVSLRVLRAERPGGEGGGAGRSAGNLQAWARDVRYAAALRIALQIDAHAHARVPTALVAAGHTATDQVETILYRLAASPGRRALLGMSAREGQLVRPLLGVTREQTAAHCIERGLTWRDDLSNDSDVYARARVRHGLLPALRAVHPAADANVLRTAELLREETQLLDGLVDAELGGGDGGGRSGGGRGEGGARGAPADSIALDRLAALHPALARLVLVRLAERAAGPGAFVPQAGDRVGEILALARRGGRAELHIGGLLAAVIGDGRLRMVKIAPHYPSPHAD
jgi:tRNA(Ile)-lysidine synthase